MILSLIRVIVKVLIKVIMITTRHFISTNILLYTYTAASELMADNDYYGKNLIKHTKYSSYGY